MVQDEGRLGRDRDDIREKELHNKYFKNIKNAVDAVCDGLNRLNANPEYLKSLTNFFISQYYILEHNLA